MFISKNQEHKWFILHLTFYQPAECNFVLQTAEGIPMLAMNSSVIEKPMYDIQNTNKNTNSNKHLI